MEKRTYQSPDMEVIEFEEEDIITTSPVEPERDENETIWDKWN